jgi:hypothetical protein
MAGALIASIIASAVAAAATKFFFLMRFLASLSKLCITENLPRTAEPAFLGLLHRATSSRSRTTKIRQDVAKDATVEFLPRLALKRQPLRLGL